MLNPKNHRERSSIRRTAFAKVLEAYNTVLEVYGQPKAADYSRNTGGQGAQYAPNAGFKYLDFKIDVDKVLKRFLDPREYRIFTTFIVGSDIDPTCVSEALLEYQERIGSIFIGQQLYPVTEYFRVVKGQATRNRYAA